MFTTKYIETKVREALGIQGRGITKADLKKITGILINDTGAFVIPIAWYMDSSAYAMQQPDLALNAGELMREDGWESDMALFCGIKSFYCMTSIPVESFIGSYTSLVDLQLVGMRVEDWSFLTKMKNLHMAMLSECGNGDDALRHLCSLYSKQQKRIAAYKAKHPDSGIELMLKQRHLDYISLTSMGITDVSPLKSVTDLTELDLSWNKISDIKPMAGVAAYCLSLRHNSIEDISSINISDTYMLNLRWNDIKTVKPIISKSRQNKAKQLARLYLGHNTLPEKELAALLDIGFTVCDYYDIAVAGERVLPDGISIDKDDCWLIEKVTDREGNKKLEYPYDEWTGSTVTNIRIGRRAGLPFIRDNHGNPVSTGAITTSLVENVELDGDLLRITTLYSTYYLRRVI